MKVHTLRPGLLVSMATSCRGNVKYHKIDLDERVENSEETTKWETTRIISDREEHERAGKARSEARSIVERACCWSASGLLCPEAQAEQLNDAIDRAQRVVDAFNETAQLTQLRLHIAVGKIAADDVDAVNRINREVRELIDDMAVGMQRLDVKAIRDAADKARQLGGMLSPEANVRVQVAIKTARDAAKQIVAAGAAAETVIDQYAIDQLKAQRTAFLDLSDEVEVAQPVTVARSLDLEV